MLETASMRVVAGKARLVVLAGDQVGRVYPIDHVCDIGRSDDLTISLTSPDISRHHACVRYRDDEGWTLEDLGSSNGTSLDGLPVSGCVPLGFGARIMLGGSQLLIFTHHDVLEDQIRQMQKLESLGRLAGEVAHDLRNMLTVYQFNVGLLEEALEKGQLLPIGGLSPLELQESISSLSEATNRASGLTGRLLGFARVGPGQQEPVDMASLVEDVVAMVQRTFPDNIQVEARCTGNKLVVLGQKERLHQALMNLCINARDAMPQGGRLTLSVTRLNAVAAALVELPLSGEVDHIIVGVRDRGVGMDEVTRGQIFEPFFTTKGEGRGTGLGLATVYAVIKDHGGDIQVNSTPGRGTEFTFMLPRAIGPGEARRTSNMPSEERFTSMGSPRNVLVISSRSEGRSQLAQVIQGLTLTASWEETGQEGLSMLQAERQGIVAILLDQELGDEAITPLAAAIRRAAQDLPLILLARDQLPREELTRRASDVGAHAVLLSPVTQESLRQALSSAMDRVMSST